MTEQDHDHRDEPQGDAAPAADFAALGLHDALLEAIEGLGFESPTPVQAAAIPPLLAGEDVVGLARTGSGKTAAFSLPLLQRITRDGKVRALIMAPTRELAQQVTAAMRSFEPTVRSWAIYGGSAYGPQLKALKRGVSVIVGTPGRLLDLLDKGALDLSGLEVLVLDEGDHMLQLGFLEDVEQIIAAAPDARQMALFSATMPPDIRRLAERWIPDAVQISVGGGGPKTDHIEQRWMRVPHAHKLEALLRVLEGQPGVPTIVFARTRKGCAEVADALIGRGVSADALHGDLNQPARERVLGRLRSGAIQVLVATDVAARGLDVDRLELVVNLDLPDSIDDYVHRIGRTGRAGREGVAISFVTPRQRGFLHAVRKRFGVELTQIPVPSDADVVRQQRGALEARLEEVRDDASLDEDAADAVARLVDSGDWTAEQVAAAALHLLAEEAGVSLGALPDDEPPAWSVERHRGRDPRERRGPPDRQPSRAGPRGDKPGRPPRGLRGDHSGPVRDEVALFLAAGRRHGVGKGDLVGALANECGIPGERIGRITVLDGRSFVVLQRGDLDKILRERKTLELRGRHAKLDVAR